jgi:hypothetical protein
VPQEIYTSVFRKSVVFILNKVNGGYNALGTGFFVGKRFGDKGNLAGYLVTAKHVLKFTGDKFPSKVYIRINTLKGIAQIFELDLDKIGTITHPDESVDVALIPCAFPESYDIKVLTEEFFCTPEVITQKEITEGEEIFFPGLFSSYAGNKKNYPVTRFGKLSLLTDEKIEIQEYGKPQKLAHLYLVECQSIGGFSGSPVFFYLGPYRKPGVINMGGPEIYLAGVMKGHYNDFRINPVLELKDNILRELNTGIALVTPAYYITEILESKAVFENIEHLKNQGL